MAANGIYRPDYGDSHALVVGIDNYHFVNPLLQAANDARAVAQILVKKFNFPEDNINLLINGEATRDKISEAYFKFTDNDKVGIDDRVLIFFAGHGHTVPSRRGEAGFLVPVDGNTADLATLIRWDQLTRNADLVQAKHMLFLMDACYGGLALTRTSIPPGSMRFLKDMLQRYARQVLTAGKADEVVSDSGGTRPGHSIFTSHLLDGLDGAAASAGIVTGHGLMAYVYDKVGGDTQSHQTPHFGFIDGDGDFIFDTSALVELEPDPGPDGGEPGRDLLIKAPSTLGPPVDHEGTVADTLKQLIASQSEKIRLNDYVSEIIRRTIENISQDKFPPNDPLSDEEFASRIEMYERATADLLTATILLAHWAEPAQIKLLERIFARVAEADRATAGKVLWLRLSWYPMLILMYAAGISALAAGRFDTLHIALLTPISANEFRSGREAPVVLTTIAELTDIVDQFKNLPGMARMYVPRSEHIYKRIQPLLEDQLLLGRSYDALFDAFEILMALTFADVRDDDVTRSVWGPPGRFAWKERGLDSDPVFTKFVEEAKGQGETWGPLQVGFFGGSLQRFADVADAYARRLSQVNWW